MLHHHPSVGGEDAQAIFSVEGKDAAIVTDIPTGRRFSREGHHGLDGLGICRLARGSVVFRCDHHGGSGDGRSQNGRDRVDRTWSDLALGRIGSHEVGSGRADLGKSRPWSERDNC